MKGKKEIEVNICDNCKKEQHIEIPLHTCEFCGKELCDNCITNKYMITLCKGKHLEAEKFMDKKYAHYKMVLKESARLSKEAADKTYGDIYEFLENNKGIQLF